MAYFWHKRRVKIFPWITSSLWFEKIPIFLGFWFMSRWLKSIRYCTKWKTNILKGDNPYQSKLFNIFKNFQTWRTVIHIIVKICNHCSLLVDIMDSLLYMTLVYIYSGTCWKSHALVAWITPLPLFAKIKLKYCWMWC